MASSKSFLLRYLRKLLGAVPLLVFVFFAGLFLFGFVMHEVILEKEEMADQRVFHYLSAFIHPGTTGFMKTVTWFASARFLQISYGILVLAYILAKNWKRAIEIGVIGLGGFLVNYFMKLFFERPRPPHPLLDPLQNFSFPSGHAMSGFIFYGLLAYVVWKTEWNKTVKWILITALILFALLIGFSRVYLRMHYATDVCAGFCIGLAWLSLSIWLLGKMKTKSDKDIKQGKPISG